MKCTLPSMPGEHQEAVRFTSTSQSPGGTASGDIVPNGLLPLVLLRMITRKPNTRLDTTKVLENSPAKVPPDRGRPAQSSSSNASEHRRHRRNGFSEQSQGCIRCSSPSWHLHLEDGGSGLDGWISGLFLQVVHFSCVPQPSFSVLAGHTAIAKLM